MSSLTNLTQSQRTELRHVDPIQLVHIALPSGTVLYFSDIDYVYKYGTTSVYYDSYVKEINGLGNIVEIDNVMNPTVSIVLKNEPWSSYDYLILLNSVDEFTRASISIYEIRVMELTESFSSDTRTLLWSGNVKQVEDISKETFQLTCCSRLHNKKNALNLQTVEKETFPSSHPPDRGKYRNRVYGSVDKLLTRCIKTGAMDNITLDMTASQTTVPLSGITEIPFETSGQVQIDEEVISYSSINYSGDRPILLTGCTRAAGSTSPYNVAAIHDKGAAVGQVVDEFIYEVADHPVESIDNVFVDDIRQESSAPFTTYTGQSTNQLTGYEGTALVRFTVQPYVGQQINVEVEDHEHTTDTGSHSHGAVAGGSIAGTMGSASAVYSYPDVISNVSNASDGNTSTYATVTSSRSYPSIFTCAVDIPFTTTIPAGNNLTSAVIGYYIKTSLSSQYTEIIYNGSTIATRTGILPAGRYEIATGDSAGDGALSRTLRINHSGSTSGSSCDLRVYEADITFYYTSSSTGESPATGVDTSKVGTTSLSGGTSTSTIVIGNEITVDVDGFKDDVSGTYTGTPSAIIERPDHVYKHLLKYQLGFVDADIDSTSFTASGSYYDTNSYVWAFAVNDIGTETDKVFGNLAYQIHSMFYEWFGKFYLEVLPTTEPTADLVIYDEDILEYPKYSYTNLDDLKNKLRAFYLRDYREGSGNSLEGVLKSDAMAEGYMDVLVNSNDTADLQDDLYLNSCRNSTMAQSVLDFWLVYKSSSKLILDDMKLRWKAIQIGPGDNFEYTDPIFGRKVFRITNYKPDRKSGTISISGIETP